MTKSVVVIVIVVVFIVALIYSAEHYSRSTGRVGSAVAVSPLLGVVLG